MRASRTHSVRNFADPYLTCEECQGWVTGWHDPQACGCGERVWNMPCQHRAGALSVCPSWGPVDGCRCERFLGQVSHEQPPRVGRNMTGDVSR